MDRNLSLDRKKRSENEDPEKLNVIVADTELSTFENLRPLQDEFRFLNLSSEFAADFILDYEKTDILFLGKKIASSEKLMRKAEKKRVKVFVIGTDIKYPVDVSEVRAILEFERTAKIAAFPEKRQGSRVRGLFKNILSDKNPLHKSFSEQAEQEEDKAFLKHEAEKALEAESEDEWLKILSGEKEAEILPESHKEQDIAKSNIEHMGSNNSGDYGIINAVNNEAIYAGPSGNDAGTETEKKYGSSTREAYKDFWEENIIETELRHQKKEKAPGSNEPFLNKEFIAIKQKVLVFIKAKGGVGSTILSVLLAYQLRKLKTLLVDMNFSEGGSDLGYYLDVPKSPNMMVFTEGYNRSAMDNSIINYKGYFDILQAPPSYEMTKKLDLQDIYSLVDVARKKYHLIIFDMPNQINDIFLGVIDMADIAILVSDFTTGSFGRLASITNRFIYNEVEKILVLNRRRNGNAIALAKSSLKDFYGVRELVSIDESEALSERTSFTGTDMSRLKEANILTEKVLEKLSCE
jgi:MinD-like ATPase involved in chromosome partitioning or flagellar assembly